MDNLSARSIYRSPEIITIVSLTLAYTIAYAIDSYLQQLRQYAGETFNFTPAIVISAIIPVGVVIGILVLSWLALSHLPPSRFVAIIFMISGLFVLVEYFSILVGFPMWLRPTIIGQFRYALMDYGAQSSTYYLASACIVIGIAALRRYAEDTTDSSQDA